MAKPLFRIRRRRPSYEDRATILARVRRRLGIAIHRISWAYLLMLLVFWGYLRWRGDRSALATVLLFGPVWISIVPALVLIPFALALRRRSLLILIPALLIALFSLTGVCVPWRTILHRTSNGPRVRVLTCNVNRSSLDDAALARLVGETRPDVVALQEWPLDRKQPAFVDSDWHWFRDGELLVASRFPIANVQGFHDPRWGIWGGAAARCDIAAPGAVLHLIDIHLASPHNQFQEVISEAPNGTHDVEQHLAIRAGQSRMMSALAQGLGGGVIITGDFNSIAEGNIYRQYWSQFSDAFATAGFGVGHTYFSEGAAVRIDHVLAGSDWRCARCWVGPSVGSPHRPVIADLERVKDSP